MLRSGRPDEEGRGGGSLGSRLFLEVLFNSMALLAADNDTILAACSESSVLTVRYLYSKEGALSRLDLPCFCVVEAPSRSRGGEGENGGAPGTHTRPVLVLGHPLGTCSTLTPEILPSLCNAR